MSALRMIMLTPLATVSMEDAMMVTLCTECSSDEHTTDQHARLEQARALFEADYTADLTWDSGLGDYILAPNAAPEWDEDDDVFEQRRGGETVRVIRGDVISERLNYFWDQLDTQSYWLDRLP